MMEILEWNINQRCNYNNIDSFPDFILKELLVHSKDVIILTEFKKITNWISFANSLSEYNVFVTNNATNEILMAIKKSYAIKNTLCWTSSYEKRIPDYIEILLDCQGEETIVIGTRILVDNYDYNNAIALNNEMQARKEQAQKIVKRMNEHICLGRKIIAAGDFNVGRKDNPNTTWSINAFKTMLTNYDLEIDIPDGYSQRPYRIFACQDLFIHSKSIITDTISYNWEFTKNRPDIYYQGKRTIGIKNPYPDHAILIAKTK